MKKRRIVSFILVLVLVITIPCSVFIYRALTKDDDDTNNPAKPGGSSASAVSQVIQAVGEMADTNYKIIKDYSANNAEGAQNYAAALTLDKLNTYFGAFTNAIMIPSAFDYVFSSAGSGVYQNSFELDKTYFSRETNGENTYIYYFKAEKLGSIVNLYCEFEGELIICQVEYDFENDILISAKTITRGLFAFLDYERNSFTMAQFQTAKTLQDILDGNMTYDDITKQFNYEKMYSGNIAKNVNSIELNEFEFDGSEVNKGIFNNYIQEFEMDIDASDVFEKADAVINNSFVGAMEYSMRRIGQFEIKQVGYEFKYFSYWIDFNDIVSLLEKLKNSTKLAGEANSQARAFLNSYKNWLADRGSRVYTGDCSYSFGDDMISVTKAKGELNAYIVTIYIDGSVKQICCTLSGNILDIKADDEYLATKFETKVAGTSGNEYVIITRADTDGSVIDIPETLTVQGYADPLPVKKIGQQSSSDYFNVYSSSKILILNIPVSVEEIYTNSWLDVAVINVDEANTDYCSVDGVLYTKDMEHLVRFPAYKVCEEYDIPNGVKYIDEDAFQGVKYLEVLNVPSSVIDGIETRHFWAAFSIREININSNSVYTSYNGIVYSADGETLLMCPAGKTGVITIKNGTINIGECSFGYCKFVTEIVIPDSVTSIQSLAFTNCESLKTLTLGKDVEIDNNFNFGGLNALETVNVHKDNAYLWVDSNGFVYSKDKTILYFCPRSYEGKVTIASTVKRIEDYAFDSCSKITEIVVPTSVEEIGIRAFQYSSASKITILGSVSIDYEAFFRGSLKELYIEGLRDMDGYTYAFSWSAFDEAGISELTFGGTKAEFEASINPSVSFARSYLDRLVVKCSDGNLTFTND